MPPAHKGFRASSIVPRRRGEVFRQLRPWVSLNKKDDSVKSRLFESVRKEMKVSNLGPGWAS